MRSASAARREALIAHDRHWWQGGAVFAGMDEVGRGPLAGCVLAACVIMPPEPLIPGIDDSKRIGEKRREQLHNVIMRAAVFVGIGRADPEEIDAVNILCATRLAMERAAEHCPAEVYLVDAVQGLRLRGKAHPIIKGDASSYSIAAASIVAKVVRDREMRLLHQAHPRYGFAANKGYGTAEHIAALKALGPCDAHRRSFIGGILQRL